MKLMMCKTCEKIYSRNEGTTSLKGHLKSLHVTVYDECLKLDTEKNTIESSSSTPNQEVRKHITLKDILMRNQKWFSSHPKSIEIHRLISGMIALQNLPFNFVEGIRFSRLIQFIVPNYHLM